MSSFKRGLVFAMEEDTTGGEEAVMDTVPETAAEVEADSSAIVEQVGEIDQIDTAVADAETDAGTIGEIQGALQESVDQGEGVTEATAEVAEIAVEAICARLGMKPGSGMPSLESFGNKSSRLTATKYAIESFGEKIKQIWQSILKALKFVWEKIKNFFLSFTKSRAKLKEHLQNLQKLVAKAQESAKPAAVTGSGLLKNIAVSGKVSANGVVDMLNSSEFVMKMSAEISTSAVKMAGKLATDNSTENLAGALAEYSKNVQAMENTQANSYAPGTKIVVKDITIFGKQFKTLGVERIEGAPVPKEADALSKSEMSNVLEKALKTVDALMTFEKIEKDQEQVMKKCQQLVDEYIKISVKNGGQDDDGNDKTETTSAKEMQKIVSTLNRTAASVCSQIPANAYRSVKAAGDYVSASLAAHGKGGAAKSEDKKDEAKKD